jgi:hypothetical protein
VARWFGQRVFALRTLNTRLFVAGQPLDVHEQEKMQQRWYRLNAVRIALTAGAWLSAANAHQDTRA